MEKMMTLYNKDHPVLRTVYDDELHRFIKITDIYDLRYAPPAILDYKGTPSRKDFNDWWEHRAIPASRNHLEKDFPYLGSTLFLTEQNMGLSLSDRYWVTDRTDISWRDVNFFDNPFTEDLGFITLGEKQQSHDLSENMFSPDSTLNGDLQKKWTVRGRKRFLLKAGSGPFYQEPYNEVAASLLHQMILSDGDFVAYELYKGYCACSNMLHEDEELIPMYDILKNAKKPNHLSDYQFCVELCEKCGIATKDVVTHLEKMLTCDFILANHDRHYRNFGLIRNVETLKYVRLAPIYDTGSCLWHDKITLDKPNDYRYIAKPFGRDGMVPKDQLKLFHGYTWFDERKLDGFTRKAAEILRKDPLLSKVRIDKIMDGLERNIEYVTDYIRKQ